MPVEDGLIDGEHGDVVKLIDGDGIEMTQEPRSDRISPSAWENTKLQNVENPLKHSVE